jgi:hypothetical protein
MSLIFQIYQPPHSPKPSAFSDRIALNVKRDWNPVPRRDVKRSQE